MRQRQLFLFVLATILLSTSTLCFAQATTANLAHEETTHASLESTARSADFAHGNPNGLIDGIGWVVGLPGKILHWDRRIDNHDVSSQTEEKLREYITINNLEEVKFRINQYDPLGELTRLRNNKHVAPGWRYTVGSLHLLHYTVFPGRIWGGDAYNPYTNTVNIYSDIPAIGMVEAAYAKDVQSRELPGTYAAVQELPGVSLWHATLATNDVLQYHNAYATKSEQTAAESILAPHYGMQVGGAISSYIPSSSADPLLIAGGAIAGHILKKSNRQWIYATNQKYPVSDTHFQLTSHIEEVTKSESTPLKSAPLKITPNNSHEIPVIQPTYSYGSQRK